MSGNTKNNGRFLLILFLTALYCFGCQGTQVSSLKEQILQNPNDYLANYKLGLVYLGRANKYVEPSDKGFALDTGIFFQDIQLRRAISNFKESIRAKEDFAEAHVALGTSLALKGKHQDTFGAISHVMVASELFKKQGQPEGAARAKVMLRDMFKMFKKFSPEDFAHIRIPESSQPSFPVRPPQSQQPPKSIESAYSGTGFLFSAKDYVITNWHVVRGTNNIKVKFLNGEEIKAEVALKDPQNDIAFLKLEQSPQLPASDLKIADSSKVKMGDKVFTIGYPAHFLMGDNPKYTEGVVNATSGLQDDPTVFQVSVEIQPGNSGGPLFNATGEVIGITSSSLDPKAAVKAFGTLPQNVNYAIKSTYISALLPMLPQTLIASRGIVIVPAEPENTLANFIEKAKKNIVLIEAKE
jgi:S1-C subfamily serine protease